MKAAEVLRQYQAGKRDFRGEDLRGQKFIGEDLSGTDFSECDIRGANFKNANLTGVNFSKARSGLTNVGMIYSIALIIMCIGLSQYIAIYTFTDILDLLNNKNLQEILYSILSIVLPFIYFQIAALKNNLSLAISIILISVVLAILITHDIAIVAAILLLLLGFCLISVGFALGIAITSKIYVSIFISVASSLILGSQINNNLGIVLPTVILTFVGSYAGYYGIEENPDNNWIKQTALPLSNMWGTLFFKSNLTQANFTNSRLPNTNFTGATTTLTCWKKCHKIKYSTLGKSPLSNRKIRELLVTGNGENQDFYKAELKDLDLNNANFKRANLKEADLSGATLKNADLRNANLTEVNAINTDLTRVNLTGACIESWNIDHRTILNDIICQYIYLLADERERRPLSRDFQPGEFTKLFKEVFDTIEFILHDGVDWKAFVSAFKKVQVQHEETPLEIESIENKGDRMVVIQIRVSPDTNKAKIEQDLWQNYQLYRQQIGASYQKQLEGKDKIINIQNQEVDSLNQLVDIFANIPDTAQPIKTVNLLPNGKDIEAIEEAATITPNKVPNQVIKELHEEYQKTKKLIEEKYEAILDSQKEILESKQMQLEEKQEEINFLREKLSNLEEIVNSSMKNNIDDRKIN